MINREELHRRLDEVMDKKVKKLSDSLPPSPMRDILLM